MTKTPCQSNPITGRYPADQAAVAYRRLHWLKRWQAERRTCSAQDAVKAIAGEAKRLDRMLLSRRTLYGWERAYARHGIEGLVPRHHGPKKRGDGEPSRSPEAVRFFLECYRNQNKPSLVTVHKLTVREGKKHGWSWPASYAATHKWFRQAGADDNVSKTYLMREGHRAWTKKYMPHLTLDKSSLDPGQRYQLDHTELDCWCNYKGKNIRPWLTVVLDLRSRTIVGHRLSPQAHSGTIVSALRLAFKDWAVPDTVHFDRGNDFLSELLTGRTKAAERRLRRQHGADWKVAAVQEEERHWRGILAELGIELVTARPYQAWSKGPVERWFRTFEDRFVKEQLTYAGNKPENRPDILPGVLKDDRLVPPFADLDCTLADRIELYNRTEHKGDGMDGRSPLDVFSTATRIRKADEQALECLLQIAGARKVGANGVSVKIGGRTLTYGMTAACLNPYRGHDVLVRLDPCDVSCCVAYTCDRTTRIGRLEANARIPVGANAQTTREAIRNIEGARKQVRPSEAVRRESHKKLGAKIAEMHDAELREIRATGTEGRAQNATIRPVRTGFEGVSTDVPIGFDDRRARLAPPPLPQASMDDLADPDDEEERAAADTPAVSLADLTTLDDEE